MGPVLTLMRSEEVSFEPESPLAVELTCDEPVLIKRELSHISTSLDERPLLIVDGAVTPESRDCWVEDLTEQAAIEYDYELEEGWLEKQLLDSQGADISAKESLAETHISPDTSCFLCYFIMAFSSLHLRLCFVL
jgi:hypothetical protein